MFRNFGRWLHAVTKQYHLIRLFILVGLSVFLIISVWGTFKAKTANVYNLKSSLQTTTDIIDANGSKAGSLYSQKGTFVKLDHISKDMQNAVIVTEDRTFWTNYGFSIKGYGRAFLGILLHRQIVGGGSTLTQQLVKNSLLNQKQKLQRKVEEFFLAVEINRIYSKSDILSMYLNNSYFGNGIWGVQDAAKRYFDVNASQLDAAQAATLAAMLRNPSYYDPIHHPDHSKARRNLIVQLMVQNQKISSESGQLAKSQPVEITNGYNYLDSYRYPSYFDAVISEAESRYHLSESELLNKGYKIYTSLDTQIQQQMQGALQQDELFPASNADGTKAQVASIAINPTDGGVMAVMGGRDQNAFRSFNRATQMRRQPGSTIKPLAVYTPAVEAGYKLDTELPNKITSFGKDNYTPKNADDTYSDKIPMYKALANSENIPAVSVLDKIGINKGVSSLENFGIKVAPGDQNLALALGGLERGVTPYQIARAYTAFANEGKIVQTHFIRKIVDAQGVLIAANRKKSPKPIMSKKTAETMTSMMLGVYTQGTGQAAQPANYQIAGKTGSTEVPRSYGIGTKDQWMVAYTPDIVVSTWLGYDKTDAGHFLQGRTEQAITPVFKTEMTNILQYTKDSSFGVKDANQIMSQNSAKHHASGFLGNLQDQLDDARKNVTQWYNQIKGIFPH
ncbi:PBP1A family penicillin-binding protein [Lactobacillus sp. DCY120]|uniref:PBP1A family penicillin-binding protein n=2 Tax=Bombilactobacillus apium TaxID=2675299 RepID=A0A850R837_9LACO|nr:PBP1A family penicillin-binding protein [Bombilactobacillus apium]NVY96872.1 PBP1A family penicillin-binding protein [Bombilactobacillus apium]